MKKNMFFTPNSPAILFRIAFYFLIAFSQVACKQEKTFSRNWITLEIKYKVSASPEIRDITMRSIEKLLIDSFMAHKEGAYYPPIITVSKSPLTDTLHYDINVGPGNNSAMVQSLSKSFPAWPAKDTTAKPPCYCSAGCGVCEIIHTYVNNPPPDKSKFIYIDSISFINPEVEIVTK
jgi:hypothetical protein